MGGRNDVSGAVLCTGPSSVHLGCELTDLTGLESAEVSCRVFPDHETCVRVKGSLNGRVVVVLQGTHPPQDRHLQQLYQLVEVAASQGAARIVCLVPYLAYSRQDHRSNAGEPLSGVIVLRTLAMLGADTVVTIDIHNPKMLDGAPLSVVNLFAHDLMAERLRRDGLVNPVLVSPDEGGRSRVEAISGLLGWPLIVCQKQKDETGFTWYGQQSAPLDVEGRDVAVLDDLCSSGSTLTPLVRYLKEHHANCIYYAVTHFFADGSKLESTLGVPITILGTNTIPSPWGRLSVAPLLAQWLRDSGIVAWSSP